MTIEEFYNIYYEEWKSVIVPHIASEGVPCDIPHEEPYKKLAKIAEANSLMSHPDYGETTHNAFRKVTMEVKDLFGASVIYSIDRSKEIQVVKMWAE